MNFIPILEIVTGSHLYGTNTPESDKDYVGVCIGPLESYIGLTQFEEADVSVVSKQANGKNDADAIDRKFYEVRKFVKLAMDNNPNVLEVLFCGEILELSNKIIVPESVVDVNKFGIKLLQHAHLFPWQGLKQKHIGYAKSQLHKASIKPENYSNLNLAHKWLEDQMYKREFASSLLAEYRNLNIPGVKFFDQHAGIGDMNISLTDKMSKVYNKVVDRLSKVGNREELYTKYGCDTKFLSHCIRLLVQGKELMETGKLDFPLKEASLLLDIRNGKYTQDQVIGMANAFTADLDNMKTDLPPKPRYAEIEKLLMKIVSEHFNMN